MTAVPLARHLLFASQELEETRERVARIFCDHKLSYAGRGRKLSARQNLAKLGRLTLSYITYGERIDIDAGEPGSCFLVHRVQTGRSRIQVGSRSLENNRYMGSISSPSRTLRMQWSENCAHLVLKVDRAMLERHLTELLGESITQPIEFQPEVAMESGYGASYCRFLDFMATELDRDDSLVTSRLGIGHIEQMLMTTLLTQQPNNYSAALSTPESPAAPRHVIRAEEYIRAHADQTITIGDLAEAAGVKARTLFEGFQRFRGRTPFAMLKAVRLEKIHAELKAASPGTNVTDIAGKWGVVHLGRFARSYRNRFGELPSETLRN